MDLIESLFVSMGEPDPWGYIINPIWAARLVDVVQAWDCAPELVRILRPARPLSGPLPGLLSSPHRSGAHRPLWYEPTSGSNPEVS